MEGAALAVVPPSVASAYCRDSATSDRQSEALALALTTPLAVVGAGAAEAAVVGVVGALTSNVVTEFCVETTVFLNLNSQ